VKRPIFIAEISANHLSSLARAHELIESASKAGANAVKLQTYKPESMTLDLERFSVSQDHNLWEV
jgi:N-acetylneuraminate synthase